MPRVYALPHQCGLQTAFVLRSRVKRIPSGLQYIALQVYGCSPHPLFLYSTSKVTADVIHRRAIAGLHSKVSVSIGSDVEWLYFLRHVRQSAAVVCMGGV